ncbi:hypothetical protein CMK14_16990 [Candidatus Poribacteria bacterium]|nr:hypothetical protein [Candidatus Poribacteria bacterium]
MLRFCQNRSDYYLTNAQQLRSVEEGPQDVHGTASPTIVDLAADGKWHLISWAISAILQHIFAMWAVARSRFLHEESGCRHWMDCSNSTIT